VKHNEENRLRNSIHGSNTLRGIRWNVRLRTGGYWDSLTVDVAIALDHLTLASVAEGLGTCWIGGFYEEKIRQVLSIPEDVKVIALTPMGYPDESPTRRTRKELLEIVCYERWD